VFHKFLNVNSYFPILLSPFDSLQWKQTVLSVRDDVDVWDVPLGGGSLFTGGGGGWGGGGV